MTDNCWNNKDQGSVTDFEREVKKRRLQSTLKYTTKMIANCTSTDELKRLSKVRDELEAEINLLEN